MDSHKDGSALTRCACCGSVKAGKTAKGKLSLGMPVAIMLNRAAIDYKMPSMAAKNHFRRKNSFEFSRTSNEMTLIGRNACTSILNGWLSLASLDSTWTKNLSGNLNL